MSEVTVLSRTQRIVVNPTSNAVSVVNAGPQGPAGTGTDLLEPRVDDLETADAAQDVSIAAIEAVNTAQDAAIDAVEAVNATQDSDITALETSKVAKAGDTMTGRLIVPGTDGFRIGPINVNVTTDSDLNHFRIDGVFHNFHPVNFRSPLDGDHNGTLSGGASGGLTNGLPRITLAKPGTKTIKWVEECPLGWDNVAVNFCWCKEAAGSGNVHWRISVHVVNFLSAVPDLDNGAMTQVWDSSPAVPAGVGSGLYNPSTAAFSTLPFAFGIPPVLSVALQRIDDASDTYAGAVSVAFSTLSFVD